ncbi:uncharacterized protein LOC134234817 [Saccostrea cucullata]|uniref:uncharacterized protein LOC134234817 n=1 Tax=Saccostrea cuccullata TaxID=36930 RepID=UPI002ED51E5A
MATFQHLPREKMANPGHRNHGSLPLISAPIKEIPQKEEAEDTQRLTKLPSIYIPSVPVSRSPNLKIQLTDFIGSRPNSLKGERNPESDLKVNIIARDKAIQLLQQYNEIVRGDDNLAVKNLPPIKVSIRPSGADLGFKKDKMSKKLPVFTEGISSISKKQEPSFTVPKESVIRANLPRNVIVAQKKNQFTFGIKNNKKHRKDDKGENVQFKQMRKLGLDNMPSVDMGRYLNKSQMVQESVNLRSGVKGGYFKSPRKSEDRSEAPNQTNAQKGTERTRILSKKNYPQATPRSESKLSVVSLGNSLGPSYFLSNRRNLKNESPHYDPRLLHDSQRMKYQPRDPSVFGVCSLAPIHVGGPYQRIGTLDPVLPGPQKSNKSLKGPKKKSQKGKRKDAYSDIGPWQNDLIIPTEFQNENGELLQVAKEEHEFIDNSETMSYQRELLYRKNMTSPTGSESTMTTQTHMVNPPPSYVSSNDDEYYRQFDNPRAMLQIQEERSNLTLDNVEAHNREMNEINSVATSNSMVRRKKDGRRSRVKPEPKIVNLEIEGEKSGRNSVIEDGLFLTIPSINPDKERRPPRAEVDRSHDDSQATWYSTRSEYDNPKLAVKNIQLYNDQNTVPNTNVVTPEINVTSDNSDTEIILKASHEGSRENLERLNTEEEFKKFTMSSKTMHFISPLQVIDNAKRH